MGSNLGSATAPGAVPERPGPRVVLLDARHQPRGSVSKVDAHRAPGMLHLAFSLVVVRDDGDLLFQQRSWTKHHFRGRWSNSCCSHPAPDESPATAVVRRAREELGLVIGDVRSIGSFVYRAVDGETHLVEHELDEVFVASPRSDLAPDRSEVADVAWVRADEARAWLEAADRPATPWLGQVLDLYEAAGRSGSRDADSR